MDHPSAPALAPEIDRAIAPVLAGTDIERRTLDNGTHLLERGDGPPVITLHGTRAPSPTWAPFLAACDGVRLLAPDRPQARPAEETVAWFDDLLDGLDLPSATIVGHSAGGLWGLWYALARPERVEHLMMIGTPALPRTRVPLPFRVLATPGLGRLVAGRRETPAGVRQFLRMMGEDDTIDAHPALLDLLVAVGNDRAIVEAGRAEARQLIAPWVLARPSAFRPLVSEADLRALRVPTTVVWGDRDPVGSVAAARSIAALIPGATAEILHAGHVPWLGDPAPLADLVRQVTAP